MNLKDISSQYDKSKSIRDEKQVLTKTKELVWNVIAEDFNSGIGYVNVFDYNWPFRAYVYSAYKNYKEDFNSFAKEVHSALMHEYWARSEYEVVVSSWPTGIDEKEVARLADEIENEKKRFPDAAHQRVYPNLEKAVKIDVYDQVLMNWEQFINYLWTNKKLISKFRPDYTSLKKIHKGL